MIPPYMQRKIEEHYQKEGDLDKLQKQSDSNYTVQNVRVERATEGTNRIGYEQLTGRKSEIGSNEGPKEGTQKISYEQLTGRKPE